MADANTPTTPDEYLAGLDEPRRTQLTELDRVIREALPNHEPHIRSGMLGYGTYHYRYASGREGEWFVVGLASRKQYISLYVCATGKDGRYLAETYADRIGKAKIGKSCITFKRPEDLDPDELRALLAEAKASETYAT